MTASLSEALVYARAGQPVLPLHTPTNGVCDCGSIGCQTPGKHPRNGFGVRSATTDAATIGAWFDVWPHSNIGLRCDGLYVLDIDGEPGEQARERLEHEIGKLPRTRTQRTSRGRHLLYQLPSGVTGRNSTSPLGSPAGMDVRSGPGGYIVTAPSLHLSGTRYLMDDHPFTPLPPGWVDKVNRPDSGRVEYRPQAVTLLLGDDSRYGRAALYGELDKLRGREPGGRHDQLNVSTYKLAQLVAGGELTEATVRQAMQEAGVAFGFDPREVARIIGYAVDAGLTHPRRKRS